MSEIGTALNTLLSKIGDFFDIFDLSFFVSGAVCFGALLFGNRVGGFVDAAVPNGYEWLALALGCYVLGLLCFAGGRMLRPRKPGDFAISFRAICTEHGLFDRYGAYFAGLPTDAERLYNRLWAEVRQTASLAPSFALLRRYWVMAAAYDGIGMSLLVWWIVLAFWCVTGSGPMVFRVLPLVVIPGAVWLCRREAGRLHRFQMEELAASIACHENTLHAAAKPA